MRVALESGWLLPVLVAVVYAGWAAKRIITGRW